MKHPIVLTVAGQPQIVSEDELVFVRVGGAIYYAIVVEAAKPTDACAKTIVFVDEDRNTVEGLIAVARAFPDREEEPPETPWIPVTKRLPQDEDGKWGSIVSVLVTVQSCSLLTGEPSKPFATSAAYDTEQMIFDINGLGAINAAPIENGKPRTVVTHWMPMPVSAADWEAVTA